MKKLTTLKTIRGYKNIITVGYCGLQRLLNHTSPDYYTKGVYGWNCDAYIIDCDTIVVTGYRMPKGTSVNHKTCDKYERLAVDKTSSQRKALLLKLVKEVL